MIWLTWKLASLPFKVFFGSLRLTTRTIRFVGPTRLLALGAGIGIGLAVAPTSGRELRARIVAQQQVVAATGGDLASVVTYELANSPRTWHLPQPTVTVVADRVTLTGSVPHDDARQHLVRTAGAVVGVRAVVDDLRVAATDLDS